MTVYLDGKYVPDAEARVPVTDRGFLFADGVYEVARVYDGRIHLMGAHLERMRAGLAALRINASIDGLGDVAERLLDENELRSGDATIYIQVTRGAAPRSHAFPDHVEPTIYVQAGRFAMHPDHYYTDGVPAITLPDTRWTRCDIKSISLLPNVLANQRAHEQDAFEALFVRDGAVLEGSHSNLFAVYDGELVTYPECNYVLPGITRTAVFRLARELDVPARTAPILYEDLWDADELFLSGTTTEIMPIASVDGRPVADGRPGDLARRLQQAYRDSI